MHVSLAKHNWLWWLRLQLNIFLVRANKNVVVNISTWRNKKSLSSWTHLTKFCTDWLTQTGERHVLDGIAADRAICRTPSKPERISCLARELQVRWTRKGLWQKSWQKLIRIILPKVTCVWVVHWKGIYRP